MSFAQLCNFNAKMTLFEMSLLLAMVRGKGRGRCFPVAQMVEHGASNAKIMGSIPRESKS